MRDAEEDLKGREVSEYNSYPSNHEIFRKLFARSGDPLFVHFIRCMLTVNIECTDEEQEEIDDWLIEAESNEQDDFALPKIYRRWTAEELLWHPWLR